MIIEKNQKIAIFLAMIKSSDDVHVVLKYVHVVLKYRQIKTYHH